ncbi:MAG: radical SAM protein [Lachnospiraceae bacterium]|nr:radical SAM protein [Lachnospiraceae bacterium]
MEREKVIRDILAKRAQTRDQLRVHPELKHLFFEVTNRCNLSCLHCGSSCSAREGEDMPIDYIFRTLESVKRNCKPNRLMLCVTGGEPLLYSDLTRAMSYATDQGFYWGMTTNATLIDDKKARSLFDAGLKSVTVSLDGLEDSHNWFRNTPGSFALAQRGIKALLDHAPSDARVDIITVVNKRNLSELEEIYRRISDTGIRSWRVVNMEPIGRALQNTDLMLDPDEYKRLFAFIVEKHFNSRNIDVNYGCSHYLTLEYERMVRPYSFTCIAGLQVASIACNGDILACLDIERRPELVQGNIREDDFWQVWENRFSFFRSDRAALSRKCAGCPDREYCAGDSAHTWNYDINEPMLCMKEVL